MNLKVKNALISVSNKENLISLLKTFRKFEINIISSGGTYNSIKKLGYNCTELSKYTGFKEMLDGRVKTLHPKIHALSIIFFSPRNILFSISTFSSLIVKRRDLFFEI